MIRSYFASILLIFNWTYGQPILEQFYFGGIDREYYLYVPDSISVEAPLVFVFHGYTGSAEGIMEYSGINEIADLNGFVACYPQGTTDDFGNSFFNVGYSFHWNETVDDMGFVLSLAEYLQSEYSLSQVNIFSTGMSNGGDFSYLLACEASTYFRAIAPVAGIMMQWIFDACNPTIPLPVLEIHGTNDNISWWNGDSENVDGWGAYVGVDTTIGLWSEINNCASVALDTLQDINQIDGSHVVTELYQDGINGNEVWLYKIINGGHDWPGAWGNMDINASNLVWEFFDQFSLNYMIGDVDYSGAIEINDIFMILDEINNDSDYNFLSDYNYDDSVDMNDIFAVVALLLGF
tara:strand:+ start:4922 stop:5968 length:1047 start_codon:yes stop_codon:yes gene_type:complete